MYNDKVVYYNKVVIWVYLGVILWEEKEAFNNSLGWGQHGM